MNPFHSSNDAALHHVGPSSWAIPGVVLACAAGTAFLAAMTWISASFETMAWASQGVASAPEVYAECGILSCCIAGASTLVLGWGSSRLAASRRSAVVTGIVVSVAIAICAGLAIRHTTPYAIEGMLSRAYATTEILRDLTELGGRSLTEMSRPWIDAANANVDTAHRALLDTLPGEGMLLGGLATLVVALTTLCVGAHRAKSALVAPRTRAFQCAAYGSVWIGYAVSEWFTGGDYLVWATLVGAGAAILSLAAATSRHVALKILLAGALAGMSLDLALSGEFAWKLWLLLALALTVVIVARMAAPSPAAAEPEDDEASRMRGEDATTQPFATEA
ncbi:MAG: hypothetical protein H6832_17450 [Planctomycetes bacterium]|nr:hypothetical protein [Planctomycetota bacterium]